MRHISMILLLSLLSLQAFAQTKEAPKEEGFEMKQYYFVMLTKGERRGEITDTAVINEIQRGHLANINRLAEMGKIVVAGPFGDNGNWRGIFIFDCPTEDEVKELLNTDPAIKAGRLAYEIHPWWTAKNCVFK
ncbi:MAG: hypothetical protein H3C54_07435 [Taibaiella sp.]|nr:hypothetical protein [Taibaiella sp.]